MKRKKADFLTILHLSELYCEQYSQMNYCFSQEQNDACFRDFVQQFYASIYWGKKPHPTINLNIPLF